MGTCEKGAFWLKITVQGKQSHASRPDLGINAVEYVEKLVAELKEQVETGEVHPILGTTTASVTKLCGGIMTNIIPPTAEAELDIRTVPGVMNIFGKLQKRLQTDSEKKYREFKLPLK
ncbi:MAG: peptidase dimerization domain-containing protein [Lachnospiraceae bacterium]